MTVIAQQETNVSGKQWQALGCGVGLRREHYDYVLRKKPAMDWFEAVSENFMGTHGRPLHILEQVRASYPVALHGVSLSLGSSDPLSKRYLQDLKTLVQHIEPFAVSDHLCWSGTDGQQLHDLLPLPFTEESIRHAVRRIDEVQSFLGRRILVENVSTYVTYKHSAMPEWEFLSEVAKRSGCGILLDINNVFVNARNHGFDPFTYLEFLPGSYVGQFHLAGHTDMGDYLFDTHTGRICEEVWALYRRALELWGPVSTLIEWDENVPAFEELSEECASARKIYTAVPLPSEIHDGSLKSESASGIEKNDDPGLAECETWMLSRISPSAEKTKPVNLLNPQGGVPGEERMSVYADGYKTRIMEGIGDVFPAVRHLTGERLFYELSRDYVTKFPSREYNLSRVGCLFPEFLSGTETAGNLPFLADLARLEWQVSLAFHALQTEPVKPQELAGISPEKWGHLQFVFQEGFGLLESAYPVFDLWQARKTPISEVSIRVEGNPQQVIIFRSGLEVQCLQTDACQVRLLNELRRGTCLEEALEIFSDTPDFEPALLTRWFGHWMQLGIITALHLR